MVRCSSSIIQIPKHKLLNFLTKRYIIFNIKSGWNNTAFIDSSKKLNNNFATTMIVNQLEFTNIIYNVKHIIFKMGLLCFYMTLRNFMMTFEAGLMRTYFLPALSAFKMHLRQSPSTLTLMRKSFRISFLLFIFKKINSKIVYLIYISILVMI